MLKYVKKKNIKMDKLLKNSKNVEENKKFCKMLKYNENGKNRIQTMSLNKKEYNV